MAETDGLVKVGISIGDYNGIGMEVIIKTFMDNRMMQVCTPIVYGFKSGIISPQSLKHK